MPPRASTTSTITPTDWIERARAEAARIWCYADLISDHDDAARLAIARGDNPETFAKELGEELDLIPASDWLYGA